MDRIIAFFYRTRYTFSIILSIAALDYALSSVALTAIDNMLVPSPPPFVEKKQKKEQKVRQLTFEEYEKDLIGSVLFPHDPTADLMENENSQQPTEKPKEPLPDFSTLGIEVTGTVSGPAWFARAYIKVKNSKDEATKQGRAYSIGQSVEKAKLQRITRKSVVFLYDAQRHEVYMNPDDKPEDKPEPQQSKQPTQTNPASDEKTINIVKSKGEMEKLIFGNLNNIMQGIAVGPNFENGKMDGYIIKRIRPSNVLYSLGARSGDIIRSVNGHKIDDIKKVLKLWEGMQQERNITVDIERGGNIITFNFEIRE